MFKYDGDVGLLITASILKYEKYTNEYSGTWTIQKLILTKFVWLTMRVCEREWLLARPRGALLTKRS